MFLDLYQRDMATSLQPQPNEAHDLPATGEAAFGAAWGEARLFSQSIAGANARASVLQDYLAEIRQKTGNDLSQEFIPDAAGGGQLGVMDFHSINDRVAKMKENYPDLALNPLSDAEIEARAIAKSRAARTAYQTMSDREKTLGGSLGFFAGGVAGAAADPVNIVALPVAPAAELGLLSTALRWGGIAAVSQAGIEGIGAPFREQVQPGYSASGEPITNVLEAAVGGAVLGGGMKALGNIWTRAKTGTWPRSVRDAGNIAESEANVANTNPYPGVAGEVAHREALVKTIDDILADRPVEVGQHVTPELSAAADAKFDPIIGARGAASDAEQAARNAAEEAALSGKPQTELPFVQTEHAAVAEKNVATMTDGIQNLAKMSGYDMPREEAATIAARLAKMPDDQAARALLDEVVQRPATIAETLPDIPKAAAKTKPDVAPDLTPALDHEFQPATIEKTLSSPEHVDAMINDLDKLRMTSDKQIPVGVDENGQPIMKSLDAMVEEVKADREAAQHLEGCINPVQDAAE